MFVIGTAGHVDHGKSLLVEALTGIDPDRLREEKARGMTIDLGFAWLTLPSGRTVSIVDVPGHERFIKNMLAGAGGVDLALLVVAADDGIMPQTREHLAILDLLGVSRGVVALSKRDLVDDDWLALVQNDIAELLHGTALSGSTIVPCSARTREGLGDLLRTIDDAIGDLPPKRDIGRPRLPIDRVFTIGGFGTVVTGTLIDGTLSIGDEIEVMPGGRRARVRGLQSHKDTVERALPGTRTAVNIAGIERDALRRGLVLARPGTLRPTTVIDARLRATGALRHNMTVTFHTGADEANATVRLLDRDQLAPGNEAWAQIKLETPIAAMPRDRFVLRTPNHTVGGGQIVDIAPKRHRRHHQPTLGALAGKLSDSPIDRVRDRIARTQFAAREAIVRDLALPDDAANTAIEELLAAGEIEAFGSSDQARLVTAAFARDTRANALGLVDAYHAEHPLRSGLPLEELRARLHLGAHEATTLLHAMPQLRVDGSVVARREFAPAPNPSQQQAIDAYLATLMAPPERPQPQPLDPSLIAFLVSRGHVIETQDGIVFEARAFAAMEARIREYIAAHNSITLAEARDLLGTGRRHAQALLEHLDRLRVTRRIGERRVLR